MSKNRTGAGIVALLMVGSVTAKAEAQTRLSIDATAVNGVVYIDKVYLGGLAHRMGLREGDGILMLANERLPQGRGWRVRTFRQYLDVLDGTRSEIRVVFRRGGRCYYARASWGWGGGAGGAWGGQPGGGGGAGGNATEIQPPTEVPAPGD